MFHLAAFNAAAVGIGAVNSDLTLVNDQVLPGTAFGRALMPFSAKVRAAIAAGVGINRPRIVSPSLRRLPFPQIRDPRITLAPAFPLSYCRWPSDHAPYVIKNEEVNVQVSNTNAGAQQMQAYLWLEREFTPAPPGPVWTIRGTHAIVAAAGVWTNGILTLEDQLPQGSFAIIGMSVWGVNHLAARLIFANGGPRPGCPAGILVDNPMPDEWRMGRFGQFGTFENTTVPQVEIFASGATTVGEVFLDVVPLGTVTS